MAADESTLQKALKAAGLDSVRFASGVVGNATYAVCACAASTAVIAWVFSAQPWLAFAALLLVVLITGFYLIGTWRFADKRPDLALLGGAHLLKLREMEMAARDLPVVPQTKNVVPSATTESQTNDG